MTQTPYNKTNTSDNKLRVQKFVIGLLDKNMKVYKQLICTTSDTNETVTVDCGDCEAPVAFSLNHDAHGYGKFVIDEMSLTAFEENLKLIESRLNRK